jgi:chromosome segregation ATPase
VQKVLKLVYANASDIADLDSDLSAEVARATAAELANSQAIQAEVTRATGVEAGLRTDVDTVTGRVDAIIGTSPETLDTLQEIVAAFEDADSDIQAVIDANSGRLSVNEGDIDALELRATDLESRAGSLEGRATALETEQSAQGGRLTVNEGDIDALETKVGSETLATVATDLSAAVNELHGELDVEAGKVSVLEGEMDVVEGKVSVLEGEMDAVEGRATALEGRMSTEEGHVDALQTKVGSATLETTATDLSAALNEVHAELDVEAGKVSVLEGEMDAVEGRMSSAEGRLSGHDSDIAGLSTRMGTAEADIDALEGKVGVGAFDTTSQTITGAVNEVHGEMDAIEVRLGTAETGVSDNALAISTEQARAEAQEAAIRSEFAAADSAMTAAYIAADAVVKSEAAADATSKANTAEANAKVYADGIVADEAVARENADTVLQTAITNEETARQTADAALSNRATALETEMTATQSGAGLATDGSYVAPSGSNYLDLSTSLKDADAKLDAAIAAEKSRAEGVESGLQSQIDVEEAARIAGDSDLLDAINAEVTRATGVEGVQAGLIQDNADAILAEAAARSAADDALQSQIDFIKSNTDSAALDSLTEIVAAFQSADGTLTGLVSQNQSDISDNADAIAAEATARATADAGLQTSIDNLESATNTALDGKVSKSGDSMTGELAMGGNKVSGVANGTVAGDAVNKGQLDAGLAAQHISQFSTTDLAEGNNQYFTTARAQDAISVTDVSGEGKVSKSGGVISIDTAKSLLELTDVVDSAITDKEGFVLRAKTDGTGFELVSPDLLSFSRSKRQVFNGDGAQTTFAIDFDVTEQNAMVFVGGVIQDPSVHYFIDVDARTITFNGAIPVGTQAVLVATSSTSVGVLDPGSVTLETLAPNVKVFQQGNDVIVGTSPTAVSSFPVDVYRSAKYIVSVELNGEFETRECLVVHNGTDAFITEYGIIYTGNDLLGDTDVRVVNGVVELTYTAVAAGAVVTASASYVDV